MRIVTWNCARGPFEKNVALLRPLAADLIVIQECAQPTSQSDHCLWFGDNPKQGIAVVANGEYRLSQIPQRDVPKFVIPIRVEGPTQFTIFAVWAKANPGCRYVEGVVRAVDAYSDLFAASPAVLLGDLNSNAIWDHEHPEDLSHTALVRRLSQLGLISAYHEFFNEAHGRESKATSYFRWRHDAPYHIDYCFIPKAWLPQLRAVTVGSYKDWQEASDHRPIVVDIN